MAVFKRLLNRQEERAHDELQRVAADHGYFAYPKVRIADVLPIENSGIGHEQYSYALKAHFDFVACDRDFNPIFVVEFDGPTHREPVQRDRDALKDGLCKRFDLPLLRINANHLIQKFNKASLLRWIVSAWELQKSFEQGQESGNIPWDESFDPILLYHGGETLEEVHPHWLSLRPRLTMQAWEKQGKIPKSYTCQMVFTDDEHNYHGLEWMDITATSVLCVESGMRAQQFPIHLGELFSELLTVLIFERLQRYLLSGEGAIAPETVERRVDEFKSKYNVASMFSSGGSLVKASVSLVKGRLI